MCLLCGIEPIFIPIGEPWLLLPISGPKEGKAYIDHGVKLWQTIGSPGFPFDEERIRRVTAESYDRCYYPQGMARQLTAILAHGNRKPSLASVTAPTLVIHGADDPLVPVEGGKDTAEAIRGAELLIIEGRGHDLPRDAWPRIVDAIAKHTHKVST